MWRFMFKWFSVVFTRYNCLQQSEYPKIRAKHDHFYCFWILYITNTNKYIHEFWKNNRVGRRLLKRHITLSTVKHCDGHRWILSFCGGGVILWATPVKGTILFLNTFLYVCMLHINYNFHFLYIWAHSLPIFTYSPSLSLLFLPIAYFL